MDLTKFQWTREPESYEIGQDKIEIVTKPHTDLCIYACSPENSFFKAVFSHMQVMECQWKAHDGQQPDCLSAPQAVGK